MLTSIPNRPSALACVLAAGLLPGLLVAGLAGGKRPKDEVRLVDGRVLVGHVRAFDDQGITLSGSGRTQRFERSEVAELLSPLTLLSELSEREHAAQQQGGAAWLELLRWCDQSGLEREAGLVALHVLNGEWGQADAKTQLGIDADGADFVLRLGRLRLRQADLVRPLGPWRSAHEWQTSCFSVTSNAAPLLAVDVCFELQRAYDLWHRIWGHSLGAERGVDLLEVELYATHKELPKRLGSRPALYDRGTGRIVISAEAQGLPALARHELAHQLLWSNWRTADQSPPAPWLDEGLAEYFTAQATEALTAGVATNRLRHLELLHSQALPLELSRLLTATGDQFANPQEGPRLYAAAHLLIEFLERGEHGALQAPFRDWLVQQATTGSVAAAFEALLGSLRRTAWEFEQGWLKYIQAARQK
jgi:Protein of unknown function (DUF1570)